MSLAPLIVAAAEGGSTSGLNHWVVGAGVLVIFIVMLAALLAFGGGRDHT